MSDPATLKSIKIKSGVVKRLTKEVHYYKKEIITEKQRFEKFKSEGKDEYALKHQEDVIHESARMVPYCMSQLQNAYYELKNILASEVHLENTTEYEMSSAILEEAATLLAL